jgi:uncharacterized repeat protein (TIGR03806 family)
MQTPRPSKFARWTDIVFGLFASACLAAQGNAPYGLDSRPPAPAFLRMPPTASGGIPRLLSQTGAFRDTASLTPSESLIPYDLNVSFWSDGASKLRWASVPNDAAHPNATIAFKPTGEWVFPAGTVFVKTFELATNEAHPEWKRRLETRLLVRSSDGGVYGATYKWRGDNSDADLLATNLSETIPIETANGTRSQTWYYPSSQDCLTCHTANAGLVLGVKTRQLNRSMAYPSGITDNELRAWNHLGLFAPALEESQIASYPKLARADDLTRSLEDRARSYLDANCAHCHRPNGTVAYFDARYDTPLQEQNLIGGQILINQGIDHPQVIAPRDIWRSLIYMRAGAVDSLKMPPLAHNERDAADMDLLRQWIQSMPGQEVAPPPVISPAEGTYAQPISVTLQANEPDAAIHYTLDGSLPTTSDPIYDKPLQLASSTVVRARTYRPGCTKSIVVQQVFIIGQK